MKKILLVLLLFSLTVSCSKDEDEKVDTSTFTGLYNDTVWLYESPDRPASFILKTLKSSRQNSQKSLYPHQIVSNS